MRAKSAFRNSAAACAGAWLLIYLAGLLQKNADVAYWDLLISFTVAYAVIAVIIAISNHRGRKARELLK